MSIPPDMTCGLLIQLVFTTGHQAVTPFLSGVPPPPSPPKKILDPNYRSQGTQGSLKITLFHNMYCYSWLYPINTTEWHNFTGQDEATGNKTLGWAGLDINLPRREK